jgi:hypothetical protein
MYSDKPTIEISKKPYAPPLYSHANSRLKASRRSNAAMGSNVTVKLRPLSKNRGVVDFDEYARNKHNPENQYKDRPNME